MSSAAPQLPAPPSVHPAARAAQERFHADTIAEVVSAVGRHDVVVVGMAWNPFCRRAVNLLTERGVKHEYLEYGNYLSAWKPRLAIKMWSGWPTFPQVFVKGQLVGGFVDLKKLVDSGELGRLLA